MSAGGHRLVLAGATGGLGQAFAQALAPLADAMVLIGRDPGRLAALRAGLSIVRPELDARLVEGDLTDATLRARVVEAAAKLPGGPDLLINAAGVNDFRAFESQSGASIERMIAVNLLAPIQLTQALLPLLARAPSAQVVNVGSTFGYIGYPGFAVYCATKFGLRGYTQALRRELAGSSIAVRYFAPRAVRTALNTAAVTSMHRELGTVEDEPEAIARALVEFLRGHAGEQRIGFPERLYVLLNRLVPALSDRAIRGQLPVIRKHLGQRPFALTHDKE